MIIKEKKYLTKQYVGNLVIGLLRYDLINGNNDDSLLPINKFIAYFFNTSTNPEILKNIFESDNAIYVDTLIYMTNIKLSNPNIQLIDIKQKYIDKFENGLDKITFQNAVKFIDTAIEYKESDKITNGYLSEQFSKLLKYILIHQSVNDLSSLYLKFFEMPSDEAELTYEKTLANLHKKYEEAIIEHDIIIDNEEDVEKAWDKVENMSSEIRELELFKSIKFLEKKRIAIIIAESGKGKSMLLCHAASEYLQKPKEGNTKKLIFYFTFENSREETYVRILANMFDMDIDVVKEQRKNPKLRADLNKLYLEKRDPNTILCIIEFPAGKHNMNTIDAVMEKYVGRFKNAEAYAVCLDYVDKMRPVLTSKNLRHDQELGNIVDDFKSLVKKWEAAGITVSQYNRTGVKKARGTDERASATDIGGGWSKYENADIVISTTIRDTYDEIGYSIAEFKVEKHRYHKDGQLIHARYVPARASFVETQQQIGRDVDSSYGVQDTTTVNEFSIF